MANNNAASDKEKVVTKYDAEKERSRKKRS